jgi:hypothetical protein
MGAILASSPVTYLALAWFGLLILLAALEGRDAPRDPPPPPAQQMPSPRARFGGPVPERFHGGLLASCSVEYARRFADRIRGISRQHVPCETQPVCG